MNPCDPILFRELPIIQKIIADETWLESERRGYRVGSDDRIVRERVCQVILQIGQQLRDSISAATSHASTTPSAGSTATPGPAVPDEPPPAPRANEAA